MYLLIWKFNFDSPEAAQLNKEIFAVIYYAGLHKSLELALKFMELMKHLKVLHYLKVNFRFDLWGTEPITSDKWFRIKLAIT